MIMKRLYFAAIKEHLEENRQMLFLMGPRQVGKTTTCYSLSEIYDNFTYFSWDDPDTRAAIVAGPKTIASILSLEMLSASQPIVIFDEIHKYSDWKNFLKGFYDLYSNRVHIIVTGSARLDVYKKGGDSLMGRYFLYRFHPLSVAEATNTEFPTTELSAFPTEVNEQVFQNLWVYGGYPDPFLKANNRFFNRWSHLKVQQLFKEDIRDLTRVHEIKQLEILANLLKYQIGQQTSYESLAKKVRVSGNTIRSWLEILNSLYYSFELRPWSKNIARSLIKEPKYYLWDWAQVKDEGARAENFVASHLLKAVHFWSDAGFGQYELYYVRDKEKREVDFLVTQNDVPWFLVEVKKGNNKAISSSLIHFHEVLHTSHAFQVVIDLPYVNRNCFEGNSPIIVPARTFLSQLI